MTEHIDLTAPPFTAGFEQWMAQNGHIWTAFVAESNKVYDRGRRNYSARTIAEFLRHNSMLREVGGEWKINNNRVPDMARLYLKQYPDRAGFFQLRN